MIRAYIQAAMERAHYELIDQPEDPFYGSIPGLPAGRVSEHTGSDT